MRLQGVLARVFVGGSDAIGVGSEGDLGIDDEIASAGKVNDHVGANGAGALAAFAVDAGEGLLEGVLFAFAKAGFVEQIAEDELAPIALRFGGAAKSSGEVACFFSELFVESA
jgi:hypothetical protein